MVIAVKTVRASMLRGMMSSFAGAVMMEGVEDLCLAAVCCTQHSRSVLLTLYIVSSSHRPFLTAGGDARNSNGRHTPCSYILLPRLHTGSGYTRTCRHVSPHMHDRSKQQVI